MISFDADPRTRLVACCAALAALSLFAAPMLGEWWPGFLFAVPAILGYFAARMDWPLHAAGIALTPLIAGLFFGVMQPSSEPVRESGALWALMLPPMCAIALLAGAIGAWIGDRTHGGDWSAAPVTSRGVASAALYGVAFGVGLRLVQGSVCDGPGYMGTIACGQANAVGIAAGAVIGAILLRSWLVPVMATVGIALVLAVSGLLIPDPGQTGGLAGHAALAAAAGVVSLAAVAWMRFAMEAAAMMVEGRRV